jgi:hypothetical protein
VIVTDDHSGHDLGHGIETDTAATALHLLGLAVGAVPEGRVVHEVLAD